MLQCMLLKDRVAKTIYWWEKPRVRSNTSFNILGRVRATRTSLVKSWTSVIRVLLSHSSC